MKEANIAPASVGTPMPRSCARCGSGFQSNGKEYTCSACRAPKGRTIKKPGHALSFREQQIVALIAEAKANKEIAYDLCLSEGTVKEYLYHIFRKLNVTSRTELALRSLRDGLTDRTLACEGALLAKLVPCRTRGI
jgi:DNA-binding NarL/FixJ family response regulator